MENNTDDVAQKIATTTAIAVVKVILCVLIVVCSLIETWGPIIFYGGSVFLIIMSFVMSLSAYTGHTIHGNDVDVLINSIVRLLILFKLYGLSIVYMIVRHVANRIGIGDFRDELASLYLKFLHKINYRVSED